METKDVARFFSTVLGITPDESGSLKFILKCIDVKENKISWDDFNAIFCKGLFKFAIVS